jgi:hypothetical protein
MVACSEPKRHGRPFAQFGQRRQRLLNAVEMRRDRAEQALARFRRRDIAGGSRQELKAKPLLKPRIV